MPYARNDPALKQRRRELRRSQTDAERVFWQHVRGKRFLNIKFFRQYSMGSYVLDFYCPKLKLAIELDGGQHADDEVRIYDESRSAFLRTQGIEVVRFWNHDVLKNTDVVLQSLAEKIGLGMRE
jgi:very-short-patch-repair endonuclease